MPKSRERTNKRRASAYQAVPQSPAPKPTVWRRLAPARRRTRILLGTLAGLVTIATGSLTFWSQSALQVEAVSESYDAFSLPFSIKNPSPILTSTNLRTRCRIIELKTFVMTIKNGSVTSRQNDVNSVSPSKRALVRCPLELGTQAMEALIAIEGTYTTLGIGRTLQRRSFRWMPASSPPRWVEDDV